MNSSSGRKEYFQFIRGCKSWRRDPIIEMLEEIQLSSFFLSLNTKQKKRERESPLLFSNAFAVIWKSYFGVWLFTRNFYLFIFFLILPDHILSLIQTACPSLKWTWLAGSMSAAYHQRHNLREKSAVKQQRIITINVHVSISSFSKYFQKKFWMAVKLIRFSWKF